MTLFCPICQKEVLPYSISSFSSSSEKAVQDMAIEAKKEGKIILFNPPPQGPYFCPMCSGQLDEK